MKKVLKILSHSILTLLFVGYIAYQFRADPIGVVSGRGLTGEEVAYPQDWTFSNDHNLIAVESRIHNPHSVTVICWIANGKLHIPARNGAEKDWPSYVLADNRVRIKVGEKVYPATLRRVSDDEVKGLIARGAEKYPRFAQATADALAGIWVFEVNPRG